MGVGLTSLLPKTFTKITRVFFQRKHKGGDNVPISPEEIKESSSWWKVDEEEENHQVQQPHFQQEEWEFENNSTVDPDENSCHPTRSGEDAAVLNCLQALMPIHKEREEEVLLQKGDRELP